MLQGLVECSHDLPVVPEEDEVSLIVESDYSPASKLWVVREEGSKHASHRVSQASGKVVQDDLWDVAGWPAMALHTRDRCIYVYSHPHLISVKQLEDLTVYSTAT